MRLSSTAFAVAITLILSCGGGKNPVKDIVGIEIKPALRDVTIQEGSISPGGTYTYGIKIRASGTAVLTISDITFEHNPCAQETAAGGPGAGLSVDLGSLKFPAQVAPAGKGGGTVPEELSISVKFKRNGIVCERKATLHIMNNDSDASKKDFTVQFKVEAATPKVIASPALVDFGHVKKDMAVSSSFTLSNIGSGELSISSVRYQGQEGFTFVWKCDSEDKSFQPKPDKSLDVKDDKACKNPLVISGNGSIEVPVKYQADDENPAKAYMVVVSNDPGYDASKGEGLEIEMRANVGGPCLQASPAVVDFGSVVASQKQVMAVQLVNCGDKVVSVSSVKLGEGTSKYFSLDLKGLGDFSEAKPLSIPPAGSKTFIVGFLPEKVNKDDKGKPIPDTGKVIVTNDTPYPQLEVPLSGVGVDATCPVACFQIKDEKTGKIVADGGEVEPQTKLQMIDCSKDDTPGGGIAGYKWKVVGPPLSADTFWPTNLYKTPEIQVNIVGCYELHLKVTNTLGVESCNDAVQQVCVKAGKGCRVELLWDSPADPDQTDQCGAAPDANPCTCGTDMDLHFVHPNGVGQGDIDGNGQPDGFFDSKWDCFYFNPHPCFVMDDCGNPLKQPSLDLDDTDGAGPENLNYNIPEPGVCYKVGVHFYSDHCIPGGSYPTIRVYIDGVKKYEKTAPKMLMLDMWEVGEVCCTNAVNPVKEYMIGGAPVIVHQYPSPY